MTLNFFLSEEDQARIDPNSIVVEDLPENLSPALPEIVKDTATRQSLLIKFKIADPANGPPQIKLFFSGHLNYIPDSNDTGIIPNIADVDAGLTHFDEWNINGIIRVQADRESVDHLETLNSALIPFNAESPVVPNQVWYYPICITREFVLSLLSTTNNVVLTESGETVILAPGHPTNTAIRLVEFFKSGFGQWIRSGANVSNPIDQSLPTVKMTPSGDVTLVIGMARSQEPQDNKDYFDRYDPEVSRLLPRHVVNGAIPPRYILRKFKDELEHTSANHAIVSEVIKEPAQSIDYIPIQYTRTAKRMLNCSIYFPGRTVKITDDAGATLWVQWLPSHGIVFLPMAPNQSITTIKVTQTEIGPNVRMYHLKGVNENWKLHADPNPLVFDLANEQSPHVVLRLPMKEEVLPELLQATDDKEALDLIWKNRAIAEISACSYMSLRRTVHALLNNRIAGGRYNFEGRTTAFRNELIEEILPANLASKVRNKLPSRKFTGSEEQQVNQIRWRANVLRQVLELMFPNPAPEYPGGIASSNGTYPIGRVAYYLWQSILNEFKGSTTKKYYHDDLIGRGAPAALVALGLAEYVWDPEPEAGQHYESPAFLQDVVDTMMNDVDKGMLLQFWRLGTDFEKIKNRLTNDSYGHSPMYLWKIPPEKPIQGFVVVDHNGPTAVRLEADSQLLNWTTIEDHVEKIWIAARWLE